MSLPLEGLIVVTLEQAVAAPLCTRHLGDLGARVIKIENVRGGDFTRSYDELIHGMSAYFAWLNRNKESLALDVKQPAGRSILDQLISRADIVVQNLGPGAAGRLGVAASDVVGRHPEKIAVDISGYGTGGPMEGRRAYDLLAQAEGGSCAITGWPDAPAKPGIPVADVGTAIYALSSILAALHARHSTGRGAAISIAMFDVVAEWMGFALNQTRYGAPPIPNGVSSPMVAPYGSYPTGDGQTVVLGTTNDAEWRRLATMIGHPQLADRPEYASNRLRILARGALDTLIAAWTSSRTLSEIQRSADSAGIGHARLNQPADLLEHPQLTARARWIDIDSPVGTISGLLPPPVVAGWNPRTDRIPSLGQDSSEILEWLGHDPATIETLRSAQVIGQSVFDNRDVEQDDRDVPLGDGPLK